jgi:AraC-like DNA-binding protein
MQFKKIIPSAALQPYVKYFWLLDVDENDIPFSQLLIPFGWFELIFNLRNAPEMRIDGDYKAIAQSESLYAGQFTKPFLLNYTKPFYSVGISLQPWTGNLLFNSPAYCFTDCLTDFNDLDNNLELREQLLNAKGETEIILLFENYLLEKLKHYQVDAISADIAKAILKNPSVNQYKEIVSTVGFTRRRIEQRFIESTGLSMGCFVRKIRFQKAVNILRDNTTLSLTQIGLNAGYYDQSHFIREFKDFSSVTPKEFSKLNSQTNSNVSELMMA